MAIFLSIKVHFQGVFINKPFCYFDGVHHVFENVDFAGMSFNEFVGFLERFTQEKCEKVYYCQPNLQIPKGLTLILNECQYQEFIDIAYQCGVQVSIYMDHFGTTVHVTKANENENEDNCSVKSNMSIEGEEGIDLTEIKSPQEINMEGITYEGVSHGNENEEATEGDPKDDEDDNVPDMKGKLMFNEDIPWKKQLSILGMRDGNNHIYPIDWAIVCVENKDNWKWFLENLQEDMHLEGGFGRTLMSDQHKGIIEVVKDLFLEI
ncbi:unnamed protein product [Lactuca saligna]|uniref:PB1-like domain-containing protein n=1 Tax=Lactuca saligna TaxID=75948 RepID=A0AA35VAL0_LACSI|nr:unnamed protein product [Lactuca saligna]